MTRNKQHGLLWYVSMLCLITVIGYLCITIFYERVMPLPNFQPSEKIRVLLKKNQKEQKVILTESQCEVWVDQSERPYHLKGSQLLFQDTEEALIFASIRLVENWGQIIIKTPSNKIQLGSSHYLGVLKLIRSEEGFHIVLEMELEPYIARVLDGEMYSNWPLETLKAQAVTARTYALSHVRDHAGRYYDVFASSHSQALSKEAPSYRAKKATLDTYGLVMEVNKKVFPAFYISTCGGLTTRIKYREVTIPSVKCGYCKDSPYYAWQYTMNLERVQEIFASWLAGVTNLKKVEVKVYKSKKQVSFLTQDGRRYILSLLKFRSIINKAFKKEIIKSLRYKVTTEGDSVVIKGNGWGYHGRGLCQYGAKTLGEKLFTFEEILNKYYPGHQLVYIGLDENS